MSSTPTDAADNLPPPDTRLYDSLVQWYTGKSMRVHTVALGLVAVAVLVELTGFFTSPAYMLKVATTTGLTLNGYTNYTPSIWLVGVFTALPACFIVRYSHVYGIRQRATHFADTFQMPVWLQQFLIFLTLAVIVSEVFLIALSPWTISSLCRGAAIAYPMLYWIGGLLAAADLFTITDLRRLPRLVRMALGLWVAIFAHIFWWIAAK